MNKKLHDFLLLFKRRTFIFNYHVYKKKIFDSFKYLFEACRLLFLNTTKFNLICNHIFIIYTFNYTYFKKLYIRKTMVYNIHN